MNSTNDKIYLADDGRRRLFSKDGADGAAHGIEAGFQVIIEHLFGDAF